MKIIVIGCGSIGQRHLRNLVSLGENNFIAVDLDDKRLENLKKQIKSLKTYANLDEALKSETPIDAAFVCTPSSLHIPLAAKLAKTKINLFLEKPLSDTLKGIKEVEILVKKNNLITMMGMNYRFQPGLIKIKELLDKKTIGNILLINSFGGHYLPDWHPKMDYRQEYAAQKKLGGGVLLTSIHGLDYLRWLAGEPKWVFGHIDKISNLNIDTDDISFAFFETTNGIKVEYHTDFLQRISEHRLTIIGSEGTITWKFAENKVNYFTTKSDKWNKINYKFEINDMYINELKYFLKSVKHKTQTSLGIDEGIKTLQFALKIKKSSKSKRIEF